MSFGVRVDVFKIYDQMSRDDHIAWVKFSLYVNALEYIIYGPADGFASSEQYYVRMVDERRNDDADSILQTAESGTHVAGTTIDWRRRKCRILVSVNDANSMSCGRVYMCVRVTFRPSHSNVITGSFRNGVGLSAVLTSSPRRHVVLSYDGEDESPVLFYGKRRPAGFENCRRRRRFLRDYLTAFTISVRTEPQSTIVVGLCIAYKW